MGHGIAVNVETEKEIDARDSRASWREQEHIIVIDRESDMGCVSPAEIAGEDAVFISRIRNDSTLKNGLSFWVAGDNVRHAALKAIAVIFAP
jgi:aspartate-semialdehyde dehydrogenase